MRAIDPSLVASALRLAPAATASAGAAGATSAPETSSNVSDGDVCLVTAERQHAELVRVLRDVCKIPLVHELPSDGFPDSVFIEDTAVALGQRVLVTIPGAPSRQGETERVRKELLEWGIPGGDPKPDPVQVVDMALLDLEARMDGGDVLYTGREFLVGLSHRTNARGAAALQNAFSNVRVRTIDIRSFGDSCLHLKCVYALVVLVWSCWCVPFCACAAAAERECACACACLCGGI
jgi:N-dimethylarginine dimethylaminohydrolase